MYEVGEVPEKKYSLVSNGGQILLWESDEAQQWGEVKAWEKSLKYMHINVKI